jgi:hypothetical protein
MFFESVIPQSQFTEGRLALIANNRIAQKEQGAIKNHKIAATNC